MRVSVLLPGLMLAALLCAVAGFVGPDSQATATVVTMEPEVSVQPQSTEVHALERRIFRQINAIRRQEGRAPLQWNGDLARLGRAYSRQRSSEGFSGHIDPQGRGPADRVEAAGLDYRMVGENLARNYNVEDPAKTAVRGWQVSEPHRENLLHRGFTQTGVGVWRDGSTYHFTQLFFTPAGG